MTKDKLIIFKSYKAMHKHALKLQKYYFISNDIDDRYLATDPNSVYILTEWGEYIEV